VLSLLNLTLFGAANVIGSGIFIKTGSINADTGPAAVLSFMFAGLVCGLTGICYARFSSKISSSGSAFTYIYSSLGEIAAFLSALGLFAETSLSCAALVQLCVAQIRTVFFQKYNSLLYIELFKKEKAYFFFDRIDMLSPVLVILITGICLIGLKESATFGSLVTCINCLLILTVICAGFSNTNVEHFTPFMPHGFTSVLKTVPAAFFAYIGWDAPCSMSEETKNPKKNIPRGIFGTLLLVGTLYCGVSLSVTAFASNKDLIPIFKVNGTTIAEIFKLKTSYNWVYTLVRIGIMFTTGNAALASAQGQPRVFHRMAKDGLLPEMFGKTNERGVAVFGVVMTGIIAGIAATFLNTDGLIEVVTASILIMQALVSLGAMAFQRGGETVSGITVVSKVLLGLLATFAILSGGSSEHRQKILDEERHLGHIEISPDIADKLYIWGIAIQVFSCLTGVFALLSWISMKNYSKDFIPIVAMTLNLFFAGYMGFKKLSQMTVLYLVMLAVYFSYGRRHSNIAKENLKK